MNTRTPSPAVSSTAEREHLVLEIRQYGVILDGRAMLRNINLQLYGGECLALIGLSNSGKTMLLRSLARFNDELPNLAQSGRILLEGEDLLKHEATVVRRRIGFLSADALPLPKSIQENLVFAPRLAGIRDPGQLREKIETALREAGLWEELKDRLDQPALALSRRQQYRLSLARLLALNPSVLLLDRPCAGLDPVETAAFEDQLRVVKKNRVLLMAACDNRQASRASDLTAFMRNGEITEMGRTRDIFLKPTQEATQQYLMESS